MPQFSDNADESLLECVEGWDDPAQRQRLGALLEGRPDLRSAFAEQRAIDLALQARVGRGPSHQIVREGILVSVREEAAPQAIKRSIVAAVMAEAQAPSFVRRFRSFLSGWRWASGAAALAAVVSGLFLLMWRHSPIPSTRVAAYIERVSGTGQLESSHGIVTVTQPASCRSGDHIRVGSNGAIALLLSNGARAQLGADSLLTIVRPGSLLLTRGPLKLTVPPEGADAVRLDTPHLKMIAEGGELDIQADAAFTHVHARTGKARVARIGRAGSIEVASGQMVQFSTNTPGTMLGAVPFRRDVWEWPFSVNSPWNTPVGLQAMYAQVSAPNWPPKNLTNAVLIRPIIVAGGTNTKINLLSPQEAPRPIRYPDWWNPEGTPGEIVCAIFPVDNLCCEMTEPVRLASRDIRVRERNSTDVLGDGVGWSWPRPRMIAGSAFAGLIRRGELTFGIRHALALAVNARFINGDNGYDGHRWPGVPVSPDLVRQFGTEGNLALGALLAIPPTIDVRALGLGTPGPGFEIARALQDYGGYVVQTTDAELKLIIAPDAGLPPEMDEILNRLIPHLRLISNNGTRNPGGGGERRRPPAPPLLQVSASSPQDARK